MSAVVRRSVLRLVGGTPAAAARPGVHGIRDLLAVKRVGSRLRIRAHSLRAKAVAGATAAARATVLPRSAARRAAPIRPSAPGIPGRCALAAGNRTSRSRREDKLPMSAVVRRSVLRLVGGTPAAAARPGVHGIRDLLAVKRVGSRLRIRAHSLRAKAVAGATAAARATVLPRSAARRAAPIRPSAPGIQVLRAEAVALNRLSQQVKARKEETVHSSSQPRMTATAGTLLISQTWETLVLTGACQCAPADRM